MALIIDDNSVSMTFSSTGAKASVGVAREFAVVHCTAGANVAAGNSAPPGRVATRNAIGITAKLFVEATANEKFAIGLDLGMAQVTELYTYDYLYGGRLESEGSVLLDLKAGFSRNPSLDVQPDPGQTVDEHIFDLQFVKEQRVTTPRPGFNMTVQFGDHPNNTVPWKFDNTLTSAPNHLARIRRLQHFVVYLLAREGAGSTPRILGRLGWAVSWICNVTWTAGTPKLQVTRSDLFPGTFMKGPPASGDAWAQLAVNQTGPSTNDQDETAVARIYDQRRSPTCQQSATRPADLPADFYR